MKKITWILCIGFLFILSSCRKDVNTRETIIISPEPEVNVISNMRGVVLDEEDMPVASALVTIRSESTFTNSEGEYSFEEIVANQGKEQIQVTKDGYYTQATKIYNQSEGDAYNRITLLTKNQSMIVKGNQGTAFPIQEGASMVFSQNSLKKSDGTIYNGEARVFARYLNPTSGDFTRKMMSELVGVGADGNKKALRPLGMLHLEIKSGDGELLEINEDVGIELEFPIPPDQLEGLDTEIPSWIYDLEEEFWLENVDCYPATTGNYGCTIYNTGTWSCCVPVEGIEVSLDVFNSDATPASFVKVEFEDNNSYFHFGSYTNANGQVQGMIPINVDGFGLTVQDLCDNIVYEDLDAGPYTVNTDLPDILLDVTVEEFLINVQGILQDCDGLAATEGWVNVRYPGYEKNFGINPDGSFDFNVYLNCVSFPDMEIVAYDGNGEQATNPIFHNQLSDIETGIITSCEAIASSLEINGNGESMQMFPVLYDNVWSEPTAIYVQSKLPGGEFYLRIDNYAGLGSYTAEIEIINETGIFPDLANVQGTGETLSVEIIEDDGEYIEGLITGSINDGSGDFNIDGSFVARKKL